MKTSKSVKLTLDFKSFIGRYALELKVLFAMALLMEIGSLISLLPLLCQDLNF